MPAKQTREIKGFDARLRKLFSGLKDHPSFSGEQSGFFDEMELGVPLSAVVERVAIELQRMAGIKVGLGFLVDYKNEKNPPIVFEYQDEETGRLVAETALKIVEDVAKRKRVALKTHLKTIRSSAEYNETGPSTASILAEAKRRGIPFIKLESNSSYQLGHGIHQQKIEATLASTTSSLAVEKADDKEICKDLLQSMAIPVAAGETAYRKDSFLEAVKRLGFPLVVKPVLGNHGRGITTKIQTEKEALKAFAKAQKIAEDVIVERHVFGSDFRLLVINYQMVAAARRTPPQVMGDGICTIKTLVEKINRQPERGIGHDKALTQIELGKTAQAILKKKGFSTKTILPKGEILRLHYAANLSAGGTAENVTETVCPEIKKMAERLAKVMGLDVCGIDIMAKTLEKPLKKTGGVVLEVNAAPGFRMHLSPSSGEPINVAAPMLEMLFPKGQTGRIPIVAVTGTNGKTTTTRLISHILKEAGRKVGFTATEGIYIDGQLMMEGDCTGPKSTEFILKDPTVDTAVLECARGGMLRAGLAFDHCDVAVVTNVASDHLGLNGIDTLEKMARVKSVVPQSAQAGGFAVLNADDDLVYEMRHDLKAKAVLFSMYSDNERIQSHHQNGGLCVVQEEGYIAILDNENTYVIDHAAHIPLTFGGKAKFMVANVLAAVAAAYCQQIALADIRRALGSFVPSPEHTPGRMNLFKFPHFDVLVDYAHNPAGFVAVQDFLERSSYSHKTGIVAAMGDRRHEDSREVGRLAAEMFDTVIIREDADLRGKPAGLTTQLVSDGIEQSAKNPAVLALADEEEAVRFAISKARSGSLVLCCTETISKTLAVVKDELAKALRKESGAGFQSRNTKTATALQEQLSAR